MNLRTGWKAAAMAVVMTLPMLAGSIWLEFGTPTASSDPKAKDALALVRATGCHEPERALFTAAAEGKVDGKRKTIPLEVVALSTRGLYALKGNLPKDGAWVIAVNSTIDGSFLASAILPVSAKGIEKTLAKTIRRPLNDDDLSAALRP